MTSLDHKSPNSVAPTDFDMREVNQRAIVFIWHKHRAAAWIIICGSLLLAVVLFSLVYFVLGDHAIASLSENDGSIVVLMIPLFIPIMIEGYYTQKIRQQLIEKVVVSLGYSYEPSAPMETVSGKLFDEGHSKKIADVVLGAYKGYPFRMYVYSYVVGSGKSVQYFSNAVFELTYPSSLPYILLWHEELVFMGCLVRVSLEGNDFNQAFYLYAQDQMRVREVFQPDLMDKLVSDYKDYSIEIKDSKVYIMRDGIWSSKQDILDMQKTSDLVLDDMLSGLHTAAVS